MPAPPPQPVTRYRVTAATHAGDRILTGNGITAPEQAASLALAWSHAARYSQTAVRTRPGGVIAARRGGQEIPVPLAQRQPAPAELAASLALLKQVTAGLTATTAVCTGPSAGQASQPGGQLAPLQSAAQAMRGLCATAENGHREDWHPGDQAWFEYHCQESDDSADAGLWHRSHQQVTVISTRHDDPAAEGMLMAERAEEGLPGTYKIRFADGHEADAWEDELLTARRHFERPDPPERLPAPGTASPAGRP